MRVCYHGLFSPYSSLARLPGTSHTDTILLKVELLVSGSSARFMLSEYATGAMATKSSLTLFLVLVGLSPVLKTLTAATSSDSIWSLSAMLFCLNALLADYREPHSIPQSGRG